MMKWTKEKILTLITRSPKFVERAVLKLYDAQTDEEKLWGTGGGKNGKGYSRYDALRMGRLAIELRHSTKPEGQRMSENDLQLARIKLRKYTKQLVNMANQEK